MNGLGVVDVFVYQVLGLECMGSVSGFRPCWYSGRRLMHVHTIEI